MGEIKLSELETVDTLIIGATLAGLNQAIISAKQGRKVLIIERQTFPLPEIVTIGKYWLELSVYRAMNVEKELAQVFQQYGRVVKQQNKADYLTFHPDQTAIEIESLLREKGIDLLYTCDLLEIADDQAIIASKSGCSTIRFQNCKDCRAVQEGNLYEIVIEIKGADLADRKVIDLPKHFAVTNHQLKVYESFVDSTINYLMFEVQETCVTPISYGDASFRGKEIAWEIWRYLIKENPRFKDAVLGSISDTLGMFPKPSEALIQAIETEVLVVGGGSSGALAAIESAKEGVNTLLVDLNPGLGGTGTFGGVDSYWFGHLRGFSKKLSDHVQELERSICYPEGNKWSIEAKKYALWQLAKESGCRFLPETIAYEVIMDTQQIRAVQVITPIGKVKIFAKRVIDATGDGDIAAFAGAEFQYGSKKDHTVMWFSFPQYKGINELQNNFTSMVCVSDLKDYTRGIMVGRRRNSGHLLYNHGRYIATRESRHIIGDVQLTVTDELLHRAWSDVVNIHFSNHDMKGLNTADWLNIGLIPPNLEIEIPLRALLPRGLEHLLVVGKAISATHDAFPAIRMQADLENLGGIAGRIAALSIKRDQSFRELPIKEIQRVAVKSGILPATILNRTLAPKIYPEAELFQLVKNIEDFPLYDYAQMPMTDIYQKRIPFIELCTIGPKIIPIIKKILPQFDGLKRRHLGQVLAFYGEMASLPILLEYIQEYLTMKDLPKRTADIWYVTEPPDHGAMPDLCYLLYSLGMTADEDSLVIWQTIADKIPDDPSAFKDKRWGMFYYVHAITVAAERQGNPAFIPILMTLHQKEVLHDLVCRGDIQEDYFIERRAMLELAIGRALARCGAAAGIEILRSYLSDSRYLLRKYAQEELAVLTQDQDWQKQEIKPQPYLDRADVEGSSERIYRRLYEFEGEKNEYD